MGKPFYTYYIRSEWRGRAETPASVGAKFVNTLDALSSIDRSLTNWEVIDVRALSSFPLAAARPQIAKIVENDVARDDFDEPDPAAGYYSCARTSLVKDPRNVRFTADAGGERGSYTMLEFGAWDMAPDLAIINYALFKAALLAISAVWTPDWAFAPCLRSGSILEPFELGGAPASLVKSVPQVPGDPSFPDSVFHIPWLAYLSAPVAAGLTLASQIQTERTPDGGLLMIAAEDRLDPNNLAHVRNARILAETLLACTGY